MLDFTFSEEQESFRKMVADFARKELAPGIKERIKTHQFPKQLRKKMAEIGLCGLNIPEKYGGTPSDMVTFGIATEELSRVDGSANYYCFGNWARAAVIKLGSEEVKEEWLSALARGDRFVCQGATEAEAGSDLANLRTSIRREGDDYVLNGVKNSVTYADQGDAMVTLAKFNPMARRPIIPILVPLNLPGIRISPIDDMGTMVGGARCIVYLDDVRVPKKFLLGDEEGRGFHAVMRAFDSARACGALWSLGEAQASLDETCEYAKQRTAFGKPIAKFEGVSFVLAEMATYIELGRWLAYRVLWMGDHSLRTTKESAMLHWYIAEKAHWIHDQCLILHGHYGFSKDLPFEARMRDSYMHRIGEAPSQVMKMVIVRELLGRDFLPYEL